MKIKRGNTYNAQPHKKYSNVPIFTSSFLNSCATGEVYYAHFGVHDHFWLIITFSCFI